MARSTFGGPDTTGLVIAAPSANAGVVKSAPNLTGGTAWSAATGGTQYTDLILVGGGATTVRTDADGFVKAMQGPSGINEGMWVDLGSGVRFWLRTTDPLGYATPASAATQIATQHTTDNGVYAPVSLTGAYAARPAAGTVLAGSIYYATDIPEQYRSNATVWKVVGSGGNELGYAEITANTAATGPAVADVPGLSVTFVAGERPVMVDTSCLINASTTGQYAVLTIWLGAAQVAAARFLTTQAAHLSTLPRTVRISGLTPGTSYTVKTRVEVGTGTITPTAAANNPAWIGVRTV